MLRFVFVYDARFADALTVYAPFNIVPVNIMKIGTT